MKIIDFVVHSLHSGSFASSFSIYRVIEIVFSILLVSNIFISNALT